MKRPKVYANPIDKKIHNNMKFYDSDTSNIEGNNTLNDSSNKNDCRNTDNRNSYLYIEENDYRNLSVIDKIEKLLNRNGYIFNVDVSIKTRDKVYNTKIAGKVNNHLITLDNDIININDIVDLEIKS